MAFTYLNKTFCANQANPNRQWNKSLQHDAEIYFNIKDIQHDQYYWILEVSMDLLHLSVALSVSMPMMVLQKASFSSTKVAGQF